MEKDEMHFFYLDESGDTGDDLANADQPVLVLGGIEVKDVGWMKTQSELAGLIDEYFEGEVPGGFELHAKDLLSPEGEGPFDGHPMHRRTALATDILELVKSRKHAIHLIGIDKGAVLDSQCESPTIFDPNIPWLLAYDYLITYINWYVKKKLGKTARGMIIHDEKENLQQEIERIAHERRFEGPQTHRVKWVVEFSYPVDSKKNAMIQISDLVVCCAKRFIEIENGHRDEWSDETKQFYAACYGVIDRRVKRKALVNRGGPAFRSLNQHLKRVRAEPKRNWRTTWLAG